MASLQAFEAYVKETMSKLGRKVEDLEDVRFVMSVLKEVRSLADQKQYTIFTDMFADVTFFRAYPNFLTLTNTESKTILSTFEVSYLGISFSLNFLVSEHWSDAH